MNCGCTKNIGCYVTGDDIDFGFDAPYSGAYIFHITTINGYYNEQVVFDAGDPLILPFTFNENSVTSIKIQAPSISPINFITSNDGACCFEVSGIVPIC
jgi:hypothetical protein